MNQSGLDHALNQAQRALDALRLRAGAVIERNERGGVNERDGYPSSSMGGEGHSSFTVDSTSSTAKAAETNVEKGGLPDELDAAVRSIQKHLDDAVKHLHGALSQVAWCEHRAVKDGRSNPPTHCGACGRLVYCTSADPIRSGYCHACAEAWRRFKKAEEEAGRSADRARFERQRRQEAA